jgi:hypothetical protein
MDNLPFDEDTDLTTGDEIIMDLDYEEVCYLMKGLFITQYPEHDHRDLLVKIEMKDDTLKATFKLCPKHILSMAHRERGKQLDS